MLMLSQQRAVVNAARRPSWGSPQERGPCGAGLTGDSPLRVTKAQVPLPKGPEGSSRGRGRRNGGGACD